MKKLFFLLVLGFYYSSGFAQHSEQVIDSSYNSKSGEKIYVLVEENATFQGGDINTYRAYLQKQVVYPDSAAKAKIQGRVIVQFCVDSQGNVVDAKIIRSLHPDIDKEVLRCVNNSPKWNPAKVQGKVVKQQFVLPVVFLIQ